MEREKIKYADRIEKAKKKWQEMSPQQKALLNTSNAASARAFTLWWDTLKVIEKKFNIDVMGIAKEERWKHSFEAGQRLAAKYTEHGIKDLYDAYNSQFEGVVQAEWLELNDEYLHKWNFNCPIIQHFKDLGKTDEEIREMAPYYCLADIGIMTGFNPKLEVFPQSRLLMRGDSHCTYRVEDHGGR